ncbi:MAG: phage terminase, small subunit, family [Neobacillus sp.]|jgi:P27 family predicted phage terminase small subunit|nr:phage terminase, small subunit, family [Neobacillus sp.]
MPKPRKAIAMQKGNLTVLQQSNRKNEEDMITVGKEQLDIAPLWLVDEIATQEYYRITKELDGINIVGNLDLNNLGCYCNAYSLYLKSTKELMQQPMTIERIMVSGETMILENPLINIQKKYAEEMRKFASMCGLTIDSRLKVASIKTTKKEQEIDKKFGNI